MPRLTVRGPSGPPVVFRFERDRITVGRSAANDLYLHDPTLSRLHAEIRRDGDRWIVLDHGSRNGTRLNGRTLVGAEPIGPGDEVALGQVAMVFEADVEGAVAEEKASPETLPVSWSTRGTGAGQEPTLVGRSAAMRAVADTIDRVAPSGATVLVTGESGTGKELVAHLLHRRSPRAAGPFAVVNCPALPGSLIEAELFGVEKGVATGVAPRPGRFEEARGGTLLLDEVGDMDLAAQPKLLRVLQDKTIERLGARKPVPVDVRVLAATHHDLQGDIARGTFRLDLYHRLNTVRIHLPPLRERREDIPLLVEHFLSTDEPGGAVSAEAMDLLTSYGFPGNVRELMHILEGARLLARGPTIGPLDLTPEVRGEPARGERADLFERVVGRGESFWEAVQKPFLRREVSRDEARAFVRRAYDEAGGSYRAMARLLGIEHEYKKLLNFVDFHRLGVKR